MAEAALPPELGPLSNHGQESTREDIVAKSITLEDAIRVQIDRIAYLRSIGKPWGEAVYTLRDMTVGLEDEQFYDGVPEEHRGKLEELQKAAKENRSKIRELEQFKEKWAPYGWDKYPIRARRYKNSHGKIVTILDPSADDLSHALRIVMQLLARNGITWRSRRTSILAEWKVSGQSEDSVEDEEDGVSEEAHEHGAE